MAKNLVYIAESWETLVNRWLADLETWGRREWTLVHYGAELRKFVSWASSDGLSAETVRRQHVETYVRHLREERGLGGRSIAARLSALRGFFAWTVRQELRPDNPARTVPNPRFRKPAPKILTADQLAVLLDLPLRRGDGWRSRRDAALLRMLAWTGVRVAEAAALDWDDLDLTPDTATVRVIDGKGGRDRVIPLVEPLCESLLSYLEVRMPLGANRALWVVDGGRRMSTRAIRDCVGRYGDRIGAHVHPHMFRAQCATDMLRTGASLAEVRAVLGHAGFDTLAAYAAVEAGEAREALGRIT